MNIGDVAASRCPGGNVVLEVVGTAAIGGQGGLYLAACEREQALGLALQSALREPHALDVRPVASSDSCLR